ncbi:MAG TPA: SIS domain-containing protein [Saprospiraceae bacterium]|nr:SIS domain-containing protein [Saprospiraceae bacterium]HQU54650.1 SIS domain-containing protein [Saprospiraceae bacterium]
MNPTETYLTRAQGILHAVALQEETIKEAARWFSNSILAGRLVHLFGSGHSRIMVEEMWPRYGSFPGFHPIVELSLTNHHQVVGANGQRQAMFLENVSGLADRILRNFHLDRRDTALIISSSGSNLVPIEMAEQFQKNGIKVVALISQRHAETSKSKRKDGKKLIDFANLVLDTGAPAGDAMVQIPGLDTPVSPGSTLGGVLVVNCLKAEIAYLMTQAGHPPTVLTAAALIGAKRSTQLFEEAYDTHSRMIAQLYNQPLPTSEKNMKS